MTKKIEWSLGLGYFKIFGRPNVYVTVMFLAVKMFGMEDVLFFLFNVSATHSFSQPAAHNLLHAVIIRSAFRSVVSHTHGAIEVFFVPWMKKEKKTLIYFRPHARFD